MLKGKTRNLIDFMKKEKTKKPTQIFRNQRPAKNKNQNFWRARRVLIRKNKMISTHRTMRRILIKS